MSGRRTVAGTGDDRGARRDRSPALLRAVAVFAGAVIGQYIAGRVFDAIRKRR